LKAQSYENWHLVLIDDGSRDGSAEMALSHIPSATLLRGDGRWWWAGALQQGLNWLKTQGICKSDLTLIINDDSSIEPDFLANAVAAMRPHSLLLACCYDLDSGEMDVGLAWDWPKLTYRVIRDPGSEANCFSTRGLFV